MITNPTPEQKKCSKEFTKVMALCISVTAWLYDLKINLEEKGMFEREIKRGFNRAITTATRVVDGIYNNMNKYNPLFVKSYTAMGDEIVAKLDQSTPLEGINRNMNMIQSASYLICKKMMFCRAAHFYFDKMEEIDNMQTIMGSLSYIKFESIGLLEDFETQLESLFDKEHEYKQQS